MSSLVAGLPERHQNYDLNTFPFTKRPLTMISVWVLTLLCYNHTWQWALLSKLLSQHAVACGTSTCMLFSCSTPNPRQHKRWAAIADQTSCRRKGFLAISSFRAKCLANTVSLIRKQVAQPSLFLLSPRMMSETPWIPRHQLHFSKPLEGPAYNW